MNEISAERVERRFGTDRSSPSALRALRRTFRLHFFHAIGLPSNLAEDIVREGNLVGWCATLRPLVTFSTESLPGHPDETDVRTLFQSAATVHHLEKRALTDLIDWVVVRDDIWRQLRAQVHFNPALHRDASILQWEERRRYCLENVRYVALRHVDPASHFAQTILVDWDLSVAQFLDTGEPMLDQIVAWYTQQREELMGAACADEILPPSARTFLDAVRSHRH